MTWTPIAFEPGVRKDDSPLDAQGYYIDANKIRFVNGLPETIYGWEKVTATPLTGMCRGILTWQDRTRNAWAAFGTHLRLYAMDLDGTVTDITPAISHSLSSLNLTTTAASAVVTATGWAHGLVAGQMFALFNPSTPLIDGVTIAGPYVVGEVLSATSLTFAAAQTAGAGAGPIALMADVTVHLAPGQEDGLAGLGFGTGGYGVGGYGGGASAFDVFPRTWSFDQWGQNLLASPRGEGLYEWAPHTAAAELVTNGSFSTFAGWLAAAGWSAGAGFAAYTANGSAAALEQSIATETGAWHLLSLNVTVLAGTLTPIVAGVTVGAGITATGNYRLPFFAGGGDQTLRIFKDAAAGGVVRDVSAQVLTTAQRVTGAPTAIGSMFVTAERIVVACGSNLDGAFDPLQVDWSDAEDNQHWTPSSVNLAGGATLPSGGRIVRGMAGARENAIWTTEALWVMRYSGNPNSVYDFIEMGRGCGLIGPNAAAQISGVWYWMTPAGAFYAYGGAAPQMLNCTLSRDVKDHLAWVQGDKVYASRVIGKNYAEVWWFYPDSRDGNECSRYVVYDTLGRTWSCGTFDRTGYGDATVYQFPISVDAGGAVWFHEKDFTADGGPRSWSITSAFNQRPDGQIVINGVRPDHDDLQGGYTLTFRSKIRNVRGASSRTYPAVGMTSATGEVSVRIKGEQVGFTVAGNAAPTFWRQGALEMDIVASTARR